MKAHYLQPKVGHYGVFNGSRFRAEIAPRIADFIATHGQRKAGERHGATARPAPAKAATPAALAADAARRPTKSDIGPVDFSLKRRFARSHVALGYVRYRGRKWSPHMPCVRPGRRLPSC